MFTRRQNLCIDFVLHFSGGATALRTAPLSAPLATSGLLTLVTSARATTKARQSALSKILPPNSLDKLVVITIINIAPSRQGRML